MIVALYAAVAMVLQDVLGAFLGQAEARNKAQLAGVLDAVSWLVGILTISWSLNAINGHDTATKIVVIASVTVANYCGSWLGTRLGARYIRAAEPAQRRIELVEQRLAQLEAVDRATSPVYHRPVRNERPL